MDIVFDRGSKERPKGHALVYFRSSSDSDDIWVSYLVVLPITVDISKYVPPFLMNQVGNLSAKELSCFAFPPVPEQLGSYNVLDELAAVREDDVIFAGTLNPSDIAAAMMLVNEAVQQYFELYSQVSASSGQAPARDGPEATGVAVNEVLYGLMSDSDRLGELTKLIGRLKFAVDGSDLSLVREAEEEINLLAGHLPDNHNILELLQAVKSGESQAAKLADLYLQRCFHLVREEYGEMGQIEKKIRELESGPTVA